MYLIAGIGNPGKVYEATRHNAGFMLADRLADVYNLRFANAGPADICEGAICGREVIVVKPQTFMNRSGEPLAALLERRPAPVESIIVAYDDCDLPFGRLRLRSNGSTGGHKGIDSISRCLGSTDFLRLRLGIGRPVSGRMSLADYVLAPFDTAQLHGLDEMLGRGVACIETILTHGIAAAMNRFNPAAGLDNGKTS
ncbi:MAG: aminoacyl-tRNA hydrolase [Deltaproteobacteria bacterium]|nr:aminoacyl-tRNA hydrolase [Deltaproteobacteria bacterium]